MSDYFAIRERLRKTYVADRPREVAKAKGEQLGDSGFLTEVAGRVILTAPAERLTASTALPKELAERWTADATANEFNLYLAGRFVEAEKANRNGAFWSTDDLQFGEMSVKHGPLNWLHEEQTVIGCIADNALVMPKVEQAAEKASVFDTPMPRPYIAAVSAVWRWVRPDKVQAIESFAAQGKLWYSMECVGREISCVTDETHAGCGKSFDYVTAMTQPGKTCEHLQTRTGARRIVDPSFLGGAVIVPPAAPGWGSADLEVMRHAASLAEQTYQPQAAMSDSEWEHLMAQVLRFATT